MRQRLRFNIILFIKNLVLLLIGPNKDIRQEFQKLSKTKKTDCLFILGAGPSVSQLDNIKFLEIEKNVSIGINSFCFHDFSPDYFAFETGGPIDKLKIMIDQARGKTKSKKKRIPIFFYLNGSMLRGIVKYFSFKSNIELLPYAGVYLPKSYLISEKEKSNPPYKNLFSKNSRSKCVFAIRSSVDRLIFLGSITGFKKIVLVGIDMEDSNYFWSDNKILINSPLNDQTDETHTSLMADNRTFDALSALKWMTKLTTQLIGVEVYRATVKQNKLNFLKVYKWQVKTSIAKKSV